MTTTRREFVKTTAALALSGCATSGQGQSPGNIVDCHLHCFDGEASSRFPYHPDAPYRPERPATPEHLFEIMAPAGVGQGIVVHPEPYQDDHRYLEYCLEAGKGRLKGTCLFFAGRDEGMKDLVRRLPIVAARIHAYAPERLPPFGKPELRSLWKRIADLGIMVQLHFEPRFAPGFEPLIEEFSGTTVIIDHLGRPLQGTPEEHARIVRWERFRNTVVKLSAFAPKTQYPHRDVAPAIRALAGAYGSDRMIFGGGYDERSTVESYRNSWQRARSYISHLKTADQAKILGETAARLFGFKG